MIKRIKSLTNTEDKKRLMSNFFSLSSLKAVDLLLPLITLPYLVRVLGIDNYGILAFASAIIAYFSIFVEYGFNTTATRSVSINRNNKDMLEEIFSSVMIIKSFLMFFGLILLLIIISSFQKFNEYWLIYIITYGAVIGQILFPNWFFQGMEKMKYVTYLNIFAKLIFTVALFVFVTQPEDLYLVPLFSSLGFFVSGIWSLLIIKKEFNISYKHQTIQTIKRYLKDGWHIFIANLSGNLYGKGNVIILGLLTTPVIVGFYSLGQKLTSAIISVFQVFTQTVMPYLSRIKEENYEKFKFITRKIIFYAVIFNAITIAFFSLFSDFIFKLISGQSDYIGFYSFSFWLIIGFFTILNVVFNPIIIAMKQDKLLSKIYLSVGVSFVLYGTLLTYLFSYKGMLVSMLLVEVFIFILSIIAMYKGFRINNLKGKI